MEYNQKKMQRKTRKRLWILTILGVSFSLHFFVKMNEEIGGLIKSLGLREE